MSEPGRMLDEMAAYERALEYVAVDPYYGGLRTTPREQALMRLAIRAYTMPVETDVATARLLSEAALRVRVRNAEIRAAESEAGPKCPYCSGPHTAGGCDIRPGGY